MTDETYLADPRRLLRGLGIPVPKDAETAPELTEAQADALEAASDRFRTEVRHDMHEIREEVYLDGEGGRTLHLPAPVVTDVHSVEIEGTERTVGRGPGNDVRWSQAGVLHLTAGHFPTTPQSVLVEYTHGYSTNWDTTDPAEKRRLVPSWVQREIVNLAKYLLQMAGAGGIATQTITVGARSLTFSAAAYQVGVAESWSVAVARCRINKGDRA